MAYVSCRYGACISIFLIARGGRAELAPAWLLRQQKGSLSDIVMHLACTRGLVLQNTNFLEGLVSMARVEGLLIDSVSAAGG